MAKEANWTEDEDNELKKYYPLYSKAEICALFPTRTWNGIKQHAYGKLGLVKLVTGRIKNGDVSTLLNETPEAYYWMGFLLADGSFDKDGRVSLSISEKDKEHLENFGSFINTTKLQKTNYITNYSNNSVCYKISCYSSHYGPKIREKFDLKLNKTENPPDLNTIISNTTPNNAMALILGFIDGDGYISTNKGVIKIEVHSSWITNLKIIETFIYSYFNETSPNSSKINVRGFSTFSITRNSILQKLKLISSTLPCMDRKWNRITNTKIKKLQKN